MGYPGANLAVPTLVAKNTRPIVCESFTPRQSDATLCQTCAYRFWEHAKFPALRARERGWK